MSIVYFTYLSDCYNTCSEGYCKSGYSSQDKKIMFYCVQNPAGIYNTQSSCDNNCSNGYCNLTYSTQYPRYEYNCIANGHGIYNSQSSCNDNCQYGHCIVNYSTSHKRKEYYCSYNNYWFLLLLLIPVLVGLLITIICCNKKRRAARSIQKQALKQKRNELLVQTVAEVTLPNGQTGFFVPLTQTQQDKFHSNKQVQIYQPQPIYQPQAVLMMAQSAPQFQTVQNPQAIQIMPAMPF
ncbi:Hypothetical_protein [Hexamita inflata]|uniref:Hypothetical_protein n=1 Tax=Hexamita inflata TaxID=28002 RepID=A0AA86NA85_9EUKA|nr:Hypothetical protein HINF_LOCUS3337 [Hexamita inflata]CAI9915694.1 Hypothetical protein HINF_LOCUS3339 [Hexamita inflata]CAI9915696.1 Hypothetical protein HINF_LOCUS3341 [Hexamita inflata]CAI9915698.1 Hypothetical protein HINF_LOCUS3343 [Hexamita inflata]